MLCQPQRKAFARKTILLNPCITDSPPAHNEDTGYATVEPRSLWAPDNGVHRDRPKIACRSSGACMQSEGRSRTVGKGFAAVAFLGIMIAAGSQPILRGRAKIVQGAADFRGFETVRSPSSPLKGLDVNGPMQPKGCMGL